MHPIPDVAVEHSPPLDQSAELLQWLQLVGAGVAHANFVGFDAQDRFLVAMTPAQPPLPATSTIGLGASDAGAQVVVAFEGGNGKRPIIIGRLQPRQPDTSSAPSFRIDGERLVLEAQREIELRCGEASIVLTRAGKVLIRGTYVLSRSRGANRIKGAYVDIN